MSWFFRGDNPTAIAETHAAAYVDPIDGDTGYRTPGFTDRDLNPIAHRRAQNLCVGLYRTNPIAHRAIRIVTSYLAGEGFAIGSPDPTIRATLTETWTAWRNQLDRHHRPFARDWLLLGEAPHPVAVDNAGNVTVGYIDPTTIVRVRRSPANNMILTEVHVETHGTEPLVLPIVRPDDNIGADTFGRLTGDVFFWPFERVAAGTRGQPYLLPSLDWLDAYDQILWEMLERQKALRAFFWHAKVDGTEDDLRTVKAQFGDGAPRTGSIRWTTGKVDVQAETPQIGSAEDVAAARYQLRHIATGVGLAPHWLSEPEDANRATAEQMDAPVLRGLADVQAEWVHNLEDLAVYVLDQKAAAAGQPLPKMVRLEPSGKTIPLRDAITIDVPAITDTNVEKGAAALAQTVQAFAQLDLIGMAQPDVARLAVRQLLPAIGVPLDALPADDASAGTAESFLESMAGERRADTGRLMAAAWAGDPAAAAEAAARYLD